MEQKIDNWTLIVNTDSEKNYMQALFEFVLTLYKDIFGSSILENELCTVFNDSTQSCPMFITNYNPVSIRTCVYSLDYWAQYIYQLSHELMHYVIRQYKDDKSKCVKWFEETICEAMSLFVLLICSINWHYCTLFDINDEYSLHLKNYEESEYHIVSKSVLRSCHSLTELNIINATCEKMRILRSYERNELFDFFCNHPKSPIELAQYPKFIKNYLEIDIDEWKKYTSPEIITVIRNIHPVILNNNI